MGFIFTSTHQIIGPHPVTRNNVILRSLRKCFRVTTTSCVISGVAVWSCMCLGSKSNPRWFEAKAPLLKCTPGTLKLTATKKHLSDGGNTTFLLARPSFPGDLVVLGRVVYIGDVKTSHFFWGDYNTPLYECAFSRKIRTTPRDRTPRYCNRPATPTMKGISLCPVGKGF